MNELRQALQRANVPADKLDVVEARVQARLSKNVPGGWCEGFRKRMTALLEAFPLSGEYQEPYNALRILLAQQGIVNWEGEHGISVPDDDVDPMNPRPRPVRTSATSVRQPLLTRTVSTPPPAVHIDPASVLGTPELPDPNVATPLSCDAIHGLCVPRDDGNWILECDVLRGHRIQVAAVMDDGTDHAIEVPFVTSGEHKINLGLPAGRTPQTVVVVVLNEDGQEVGRGIINRPKTQ